MMQKKERIDNMKIVIVYKSVTGNTKMLAEEINKVLKDNVIYIGVPKENI